MDCGTNTGADQSLPSACTRLRAPRPKGGCLRSSRDDPPHAAPPRGKPLIAKAKLPETALRAAVKIILCARPATEWVARRVVSWMFTHELIIAPDRQQGHCGVRPACARLPWRSISSRRAIARNAATHRKATLESSGSRRAKNEPFSAPRCSSWSRPARWRGSFFGGSPIGRSGLRTHRHRCPFRAGERRRDPRGWDPADASVTLVRRLARRRP